MDLLRLKAFPSVAASAVSSLATEELRGYSLHALLFERGGTVFTVAQMTNIKVRSNGKDLVNQITGPQLADLNEYDGLIDSTNVVPFFFGDPTARTVRGEHIGDLDLSLYDRPLEIEVTIGAATAPTLAAYALVGPPKLNMGVGFAPSDAAAFRALIRTVITESAAVTRKNYGIALGSEAGALIRKIYFFHNNLTRAEFKKQSLVKWDDIPTQVNSAVAQQYARVPQAALYVLDRIADGNVGEADPTVQSDGRPWNLTVALTLSAADTVTAFADVLTNGRAL